MTDRACAFCTKRHEASPGVLQCRALAPVSDGVSPMARFPVVRADDYCHAGFQKDADAEKTVAAAHAETERLDGLVAQTRARAAESASQPELALEPDQQPDAQKAAPRARRARAAKAAA